jgi:hypothetical protein
LHDDDTGAMALMLIGSSAIPAVLSFLFEPKPSGIYQPRRWAVDVLAAMNATDVLADFLKEDRNASDPIERAGDAAVINAATRALSRTQQDWVFDLLRDLVPRQPSSGVIEALGAFNRSAAIPHFTLAEDDCRTTMRTSQLRFWPAAFA